MLSARQVLGKIKVIGECFNFICSKWSMEERHQANSFFVFHNPTHQIVKFDYQHGILDQWMVNVYIKSGDEIYDFEFFFDDDYGSARERVRLLKVYNRKHWIDPTGTTMKAASHFELSNVTLGSCYMNSRVCASVFYDPV
jgi:hypothetical protein